MLQKLKNRQRGFTLIELLIVVAIIGIIAALLIPNFLDALQKAKQKRTVADARNAGTAMMSWLTDAASAAAAGQSGDFNWTSYDSFESDTDNIEGVLSPETGVKYLQTLTANDGWTHPFQYRLNTANPLAERVMAIRSLGRDNEASGDTYTGGPFASTEYDEDIVWADGFFVQWPGSIGTATATP